jgi:hypothetical protein
LEFCLNQQVIQSISECEFQKILYSSWDIQQALSALTFLLEDCDFEKKYAHIELKRFKCYEANMVISFSRPFALSRSKLILNLSKIGIRLDDNDKKNKEKMLKARNKIIAHSDEDFMHFKLSILKVDNRDDLIMPILIYDETLLFNYKELLTFEIFLRSLTRGIAKFIFDVAQKKPELMEFYKQPLEL